jgi:hypothetical protein
LPESHEQVQLVPRVPVMRMMLNPAAKYRPTHHYEPRAADPLQPADLQRQREALAEALEVMDRCGATPRSPPPCGAGGVGERVDGTTCHLTCRRRLRT